MAEHKTRQWLGVTPWKAPNATDHKRCLPQLMWSDFYFGNSNLAIVQDWVDCKETFGGGGGLGTKGERRHGGGGSRAHRASGANSLPCSQKNNRTGYKRWSSSILWQLCLPTSSHHFPFSSTSILTHQYRVWKICKAGRERGETGGALRNRIN